MSLFKYTQFEKNPFERMNAVERSNVLVVGAGGIGCELLKNLVMWHFKNITVLDLDTIDVSNLNRQFLFRKEHVGKSKALTAKESVLKFNPDVNIEAKHDDIMSEKYDIAFFKSFTVVLNALDNKTARNHVNRMCLGAGVPLIEAGTMGFRGQVQVIIKNKTSCYECYPKPAQKQYPACTIRNTPSEPVHCVIWAKFLFNQLFGEPDVDQDVIPDQNDPELVNETVNGTVLTKNGANGDQPRREKLNIRAAWQVSNEYRPDLLLKILFCDSIIDLLSMKALWTKEGRVKPDVITNDCIDCDENDIGNIMSDVTGAVREQDRLTVLQWSQIFKRSARALAGRLQQSDSFLHWDKDDALAMDFVAAASNIRMHVFHIAPLQSRFEIKSIAGNIIPAIATTNAIIAGISVLQAYKVICGQSEKCYDVMVSDFVSARGKIVQAVEPLPPVKDCYVCSNKFSLVLVCRDPKTIDIKTLKSDILENELKMMAPNVCLQNKSTVIIDGGEEEDDIDPNYLLKTLDQFDITNGTILRCSDFLQKYEFLIELKVSSEHDKDFEIIGDIEAVKASAVSESEESQNGDNSVEKNAPDSNIVVSPERSSSKRKREDSSDDEVVAKMIKLDKQVEINDDEDDDDLIIME